MKLATVVLSIAKRGLLDSAQLTNEALRLMSADPTKL